MRNPLEPMQAPNIADAQCFIMGRNEGAPGEQPKKSAGVSLHPRRGYYIRDPISKASDNRECFEGKVAVPIGRLIREIPMGD